MSSAQMADELGQQLPATRNLHESLSRAEDWATRRKHSVVGLDHLMLALGQDPDAVAILMACKVNVEALCRDLIRKLGPEARILSPNAVPPTFDVTVQNLIAHASAAALASGQSEIDGANLLSAIISGEGGMITHKILEKHGLTFEEALKKLGQKSEQQKAKNSSQVAGQATDQPAAAPKPPQGRSQEPEQKPIKRSTSDTSPKIEQKPDLNTGLQSDNLLDTTGHPPAQQPGQLPGKQPPADIYKGTIVQSEAHPSDYDISTDPDADHPTPPKKPLAGQQKSSSPQVDNLKLKIKSKLKDPATQQPVSHQPPGRQQDGTPPPPPDVSTAPMREQASFNPADRAKAGGQPPMPGQQRAGVPANGPQAKDQKAAPPQGPGGQPLRPAVGQAQTKSLGRGLTQPPAQAQKPGAYPPPAGQLPANPQVPAVMPGGAPIAGHTPLAPTGEPSIAQGGLQPGLRPGGLQPSIHSSLQPMQPQGYRPLQERLPERLSLQPPHPDGQISIQELGAQINRTGQQLKNIAPEDQVIENIPKVMRKGKVHFVEVRVARFANTELDFDPDQYGLRAKQDKVPVIKAITVRLTGTDGQFLIDSATSSTQWTEIHNGVDEADFAVWRWRILPQRSGKAKLRLDITARTSSENGITAEIPVQPSRSFDVKVTRNYGAIIKRLIIIGTIFGLGYGIAGYGQELLTRGQAYMQALTADEE